MGVSPLAQLLTIAALAYASGLLLGLSVYRGEIGPRRSRAPVTRPEAAPARAAPHGRRHSLLRKLRRELPVISLSLKRYVMGLMVLVILIVIALIGVQTVLGANSAPIAPHG